MISRSGNKGFLAAHWDWLCLAVGALVLVAGAAVYVPSMNADSDASAAAAESEVERLRPSGTGVKVLDLSSYQTALRQTKSPLSVSPVSVQDECFLASERRVLCKKCGKAICGDVKRCPKCPACGTPQEVAKKVVLDADGDGLPDEWEKKYGLNVNDPADADADLDGDAFTNLEEYQAKTDPADKNDHPDYLDSLKIALPLKATYLPFIFLQASPIPSGWRCAFFDPEKKDDYGRKGTTLTAVIGDEIGASGYVLKSYEKKTAKQAIAGSTNLREIDVSEVTIERKRDGKVLKLAVAANKKAKPMAVDVQAVLAYERGTVQNFDVVTGSEIVLSGSKYRVTEVTAVGKGAKVTVENVINGRKRTLEALEP